MDYFVWLISDDLWKSADIDKNEQLSLFEFGMMDPKYKDLMDRLFAYTDGNGKKFRNVLVIRTKIWQSKKQIAVLCDIGIESKISNPYSVVMRQIYLGKFMYVFSKQGRIKVSWGWKPNVKMGPKFEIFMINVGQSHFI